MSLRHMGREMLREQQHAYARTHRPHERYTLKGALLLGLPVFLASTYANYSANVIRVATLVASVTGGLAAYVLIRADRHHTLALLRRGEFRKALWRRRYRLVTERISGVMTLRYQSSVGEDYPLSRKGRIEFIVLLVLVAALALALALA